MSTGDMKYDWTCEYESAREEGIDHAAAIARADDVVADSYDLGDWFDICAALE